MRTDMPVWPDDRPWRILHSYYLDALAERPLLGALPRDLAGFQAAVMAGDLGVSGVIAAGGLVYVVSRRLAGDVVGIPARSVHDSSGAPLDSLSGRHSGDRRLANGSATATLSTVPAGALGLSRAALQAETTRVVMLSATAPDDASGLDGGLS